MNRTNQILSIFNNTFLLADIQGELYFPNFILTLPSDIHIIRTLNHCLLETDKEELPIAN